MTTKIDCLKLINFIEKSKFFTTNKIQDKKLLIAFSGGQDSTCLLTIFYILSKKWSFQLGAVYCNHGWKNSTQTSLAVFENLQKFEIPFYFVESPNSTPMKPEQEARNWRYSSFYKILKCENYDFLLTGHTLSDCAETALFNLVRGSGLKGICSLKEFQTFQMFEKTNFLFKKTIFFADPFFFIKSKKNENFFLIKYNFFKKVSSLLILKQTFFFVFLKKSFIKNLSLNSKYFFQNTKLNFKKASELFKFFETFVSNSKELSQIEIKPKSNFFNLYLDKINKFQTIDTVSSFITFFKPNFLEKNLKSSDRFFTLPIQKLINKKKKEKFIPPFALRKASIDFTATVVFPRGNWAKVIGISKEKIPLVNIAACFYNFTLRSHVFPLGKNERFKARGADFSNFRLNWLHNKIRRTPKFWSIDKTESENFFLSFRKKSYTANIKLLKNKNFLIFRPFLKINRETIFLVSKTLKLSFHYDTSNKDLNISRNYIRKVLIPLIKKLNPRVEENIYKFSRIMEFYYELVDDLKCPPDRFDIFSP